MAEAGAAVAFCPTSNLFLGSGLYSLACSDDAGLQTSIATDIGGGTHFGMLPTLGAAYNVTQMTKNYLSPLRAFYLATLGGAKALGLEDSIGNFQAGKEADFVVLDLQATSLLARRCGRAKSLAERLFPLMTFGDDRCVLETVACGQIVHSRSDRSNVSP
jgi:guanine deaminase